MNSGERENREEERRRGEEKRRERRKDESERERVPCSKIKKNFFFFLFSAHSPV